MGSKYVTGYSKHIALRKVFKIDFKKVVLWKAATPQADDTSDNPRFLLNRQIYCEKMTT